MTQQRKLAGVEDAAEDGDDAPIDEGSDPDAAAEPAAPAPAQAKESLLTAAAKARKERPAETDAEKILKEEQDMLRAITQRTALKSVKELAKACLWLLRGLGGLHSAPRSSLSRSWPRRPCLLRCSSILCMSCARIEQRSALVRIWATAGSWPQYVPWVVLGRPCCWACLGHCPVPRWLARDGPRQTQTDAFS